MRRGLAFLGSGPVFCLMLVAVSKMPASTAAIVVLGVAVLMVSAVQIAIVVDAFVLARRARESFRPKPYNRLFVYLFWTLGVLCLNSIESHLLRSHVVQIYRIPTRSECPTIIPGDRVLANKTAYRGHEPERGDVIAYESFSPDGKPATYVKRLVALAGDTVEMRDDDLYINGQKLERVKIADSTLARVGVRAEAEFFREVNGGARYRIMLLRPSALTPEAWPGFPGFPGTLPNRDFAPTTVPLGHCFVVGDNRNLSYDSREQGPLPLSRVRGRVDYLVWPAGDWSRFGVLKH
jgi:signal peptidase I